MFKLKGSYNVTDSRLFWERKVDDNVNSDVSTDDIPLVYSVGDGWGQAGKGTSNENNFCNSESGYLGKWIKWKSNLWIKKDSHCIYKWDWAYEEKNTSHSKIKTAFVFAAGSCKSSIQ